MQQQKQYITNRSAEWSIDKAIVTEAGIDNFFWPIAYGEVLDFSCRAVLAYSYITKNKEVKLDDASLVPYFVLGKYYICEISTIYRALLLQKKSLENSVEPVAPDYWSYSQYIWQGKAPENKFFNDFKNEKNKSFKNKITIQRLKRLIQIIKPSKKGLQVDGFKIFPITQDILKNSIICTQRFPLMQMHARFEKKNKVFSNSQRWFQSISDEDLKDGLKDLIDDLEGEIYQIFVDICAEENLKISEDIQNYLKDFISNNAALLRVHYQRLIAKPETLPRHLWTGTAGNPWDQLLRLAVLHHGGQVDAHDHGMPSGVTSTPNIPFIEMWGCTNFYTYTETHAQALRDLCAQQPTMQKSLPNVLGVPSDVSHHMYKKDVLEVKTIMIISTVYDRDRGRVGEVPAEIVKVDFQARLIAYLVSKGYRVIFKAHPESPTAAPDAFSKMGAFISTEKFKDVIHQADLLLYDYIYTSTFKEGFETNIPMVILDNEKINWNKKALTILKQRASMVFGEQDQDNRFQINWNDLDEAIKTSIGKANDTEFLETYL